MPGRDGANRPWHDPRQNLDAPRTFPHQCCPLSTLRSLRLLLLLLPGLAGAAPFTAFRDGESFAYRVSFFIFNHAGDITIAAHDHGIDGQDMVTVTTDTHSHGIVRDLYAFDNKAEVRIERGTGRMLLVKESGTDPKRRTDTEFSFDYANHTATYTDRVRPERSTQVPIPDGDPVDLISALVQTRDWHLKPGEKRDLLVQFGNEFFPLTIRAEGFEEVRTALGTFQTLLLVPRMEKNPKGLFKRGGEIKVWISQDASSLPVKMQLKLNFGTATLLLCSYQQNPAAPAAAPSTGK